MSFQKVNMTHTVKKINQWTIIMDYTTEVVHNYKITRPHKNETTQSTSKEKEMEKGLLKLQSETIARD